MLQYEGKNYLIDSGVGFNKLTEKQLRNYGVTEESTILQSLEELGLTAMDIDAVLMTHLHFDHAGGLTRWEGDVLVPTFPNAKIYTTQIEWDEMRSLISVPKIRIGRKIGSLFKSKWKLLQIH